jgi:acetolactate synthase-1/2/3 large subunit
MGPFERRFREHQQSKGTTLWDVHIKDQIPSRQYRRVHYGEA